jgi:hypothetical protein
MSRWLRFLIVIILGIAAGLVYGWVIDPVEYTDTPPKSLGADFKADYVLMVAEIYAADGDIDAALQRLTYLGYAAPIESVQNAIVFAVEADYSGADLRLLRDLSDGMEAPTPPVEETPSTETPVEGGSP